MSLNQTLKTLVARITTAERSDRWQSNEDRLVNAVSGLSYRIEKELAETNENNLAAKEMRFGSPEHIAYVRRTGRDPLDALRSASERRDAIRTSIDEAYIQWWWDARLDDIADNLHYEVACRNVIESEFGKPEIKARIFAHALERLLLGTSMKTLPAEVRSGVQAIRDYCAKNPIIHLRGETAFIDGHSYHQVWLHHLEDGRIEMRDLNGLFAVAADEADGIRILRDRLAAGQVQPAINVSEGTGAGE